MPFFSVIIPVYNRAHMVERALDSVFAQTCREFEIIVVDDGSTDDTLRVLNPYSDRITLLSQENAGPGMARNLGAEHGVGDYLAFLDSDDVWLPWTLETYKNVINSNRQPSFVTGKQKIFSDAKGLEGIEESALTVEVFSDYLASGDQWRWFGVSSFVIQRKVFERVGGFRTGNVNGEDADLAMRLGCEKGFVHVASPVMFGYQDHADNLTSDHRKNLQASIQMIERERDSVFPGGAERALERRRIICRHIRPCIFSAPPSEWALAANLYLKMFGWHLRLHRYKFLIGGFWVLLRKGCVR